MDPENTEDPGLLSDDELEARQRAADEESPAHNPTAGDDVKTDDPGAATAAAADTKAEPDATATDPANAAAATAAGAEAADANAKPAGVLSKDGTRVLPYSALQAERRTARSASAKAQRLEEELTQAQQVIADLKAGKAPDVTQMTEAEVADFEENFPEQGKKVRALFEKANAASPSAQPKANIEDEPGDNPVQDAIDQVPLLLDWQIGDPEKFARAQELDAVFAKSPKWAGKPAVERFAFVADTVADEYGIERDQKPSKAAATPAAAPKSTAAQDAQRRQPETLSDFKGGSPVDHGSIDATRASPTQLLSRMQDMTDDQIDAHLAKYG